MIWLTWRQFRVQAIAAAAALAALAAVYIATGPHLASLYSQNCGSGTCTVAHLHQFLDAIKTGSTPALYLIGGAIMYIAPLLIGAFWGAPMIARELEAGTHKLAWNQSVSRGRWLIVKLAVTALAAMIFAGVAELLLTWWAGPIDKAGGLPVGSSQLSTFSPQVFGARGVVPLATAVLACTVGVTIGLFIRRIIPAMAVTLAVFAAALVAMPQFIAPHLLSPASYTRPVTVSLTTMTMTSDGQVNDPVTTLPGAWILTDQITTPAGKVFTLPAVPACATGTQSQCDAWLATQHLRQHVVYQPASRYWTFQILETLIWLAISLALSALCWWKIKTV